MLFALLMQSLVIGVVATALIDLWQRVLKHIAGVPPSNWSVVGRWVLGFRHGRLIDTRIGQRAALKGELVVGWAFHYAVGVGYALLYMAWVNAVPDREVGLPSALAYGLLTLAAPFLIVKPALGGGLLGLRSARPTREITLTTILHLLFGIGLFLGAQISVI